MTTQEKTLRIRTRNTLQAAALQRAAEAYGFQGQRNIKPLAAMLEAIQSGQAVVIGIADLKNMYDAYNPHGEEVMRHAIEAADKLAVGIAL